VRRFFEAWKSGFGKHRYQVHEIADAGGCHFAFRFSLTGTIGDSAAHISSERGAVITLEDGLTIRHENFRSWDETLEALRRAAGG